MTVTAYQGACASSDALLAPKHLLERAEGAHQEARSLRDSSKARRNEAKQAPRISERHASDDGD